MSIAATGRHPRRDCRHRDPFTPPEERGGARPGKALGLSEDVTARLGSTVWGSFFRGRWRKGVSTEAGFGLEKFPRSRGSRPSSARSSASPVTSPQHVGGFVLTEGRLDEMVPIHNAAMGGSHLHRMGQGRYRRASGLMKVDVLALGMLTCIRKAFDLMRGPWRRRSLRLDSAPPERSRCLRHASARRQHRRLPGPKAAPRSTCCPGFAPGNSTIW